MTHLFNQSVNQLMRKVFVEQPLASARSAIDIMSVLGLDSVSMIKYNPLPSGVPLDFALGNSFWQRVIFDRMSLFSY